MQEDRIVGLMGDLDFERSSRKAVDDLRKKLDERVADLTDKIAAKVRSWFRPVRVLNSGPGSICFVHRG